MSRSSEPGSKVPVPSSSFPVPRSSFPLLPSSSRVPPRVAAVLLAAGESARMARPKQLLEWHGVALVQYQIAQLCAVDLVTEVAVVLGHLADEIRPLVEEAARGSAGRVHIALNPEYREGKTGSIKAGLRALRTYPQAVVILAVDQPRPSGVLQRLVTGHLEGGQMISVPSYAGKHGHPPVFDAALIAELLEISEGGRGIREVIERHRDGLRDVPLDTPLVLTNLNTAEDYQRALHEFSRD